MSYISGEIRSGEQWGTDKAPAVMMPIVYSISLTPNPVVKSASLFIQVFVEDVLTSIE